MNTNISTEKRSEQLENYYKKKSNRVLQKASKVKPKIINVRISSNKEREKDVTVIKQRSIRVSIVICINNKYQIRK